jgi:3-oxoacyl-[acyl-carrier protein] reductase
MSAQPHELAGLHAVVTGASSGIGAAIALELASAGAHCFLQWRRNREGIEAIATKIRQQCLVPCETYPCDFSETEKHELLVNAAWEWGSKGIDIWVNNAGADVLTGDSAKQTFEQKLDELLRVDVFSTMHISRLVGKRMKAQRRGVIINIGWDQAEQGMAGDSGELFAATKGAVMAFTRSLAKSLAPEVRVNCVAPGWIKTSWGEGASQYWQERAKRESLLERWGTPEDVAHAVRFLASPSASFITGHVLPVNGGLRQS